MLDKLISEYIGVLIFLGVIVIMTSKKDKDSFVLVALAIGLSLTVSILFSGKVSGGHLNPAVSFMMALDGKIDWKTCALYILFQFLAAATVLFYFRKFSKME